MRSKRIPALILLCLLAGAAQGMPISATQDGRLGLYPAEDFKLTDGRCDKCATPPQALWYFSDEVLGVPSKPTDFSHDLNAQQDVLAWASHSQDLHAEPSLIWLGSGLVVQEARLTASGNQIVEKDGTTHEFHIVPKLSTNLSYWNDDTRQFFVNRSLRLRGESWRDAFIARTIWPQDYRIAAETPVQSLKHDETLQSLVQFEHGGAQSAYQARLLWEKAPGAAKQAPGQAVVGLMLNGAQGDDDEAHGGHFGVATGRFEADGNWSRWLVNNFYNLDSFSEKGIVAAVTPMDKYLMDLNNGQSYYRPSYMLVASFKDDHPAALYQAAINRVYNHFYRHDFVYDHSRDNCAGISIDTFRTLGWQVPQRGSESQLKAVAAYAYVGASEHSLEKGRKIYDYLTTETTRLYPAVAFDAMGTDLLALAQGTSGRTLTPLEQDMAENIQAIWFVRIPQVPSSRAYGQAPVYSFDQYMKEAPADHSKWKIVPTEPRPFPRSLRDGLALKQEKPSPVPLPLGMLGMGLMLGIAQAGRKWHKSRKQRLDSAA